MPPSRTGFLGTPEPRRLRALLGVLLGVALFAGYRVAKGRFGRKHVPPHVVTLEGESPVLPRVPRPARPAPTHVSEGRLTLGGQIRRWVQVTPTVLVPGKRYPLVLVFHGDGGDASGFHEHYSFEEASGADAILAYPEGLRSTWDLETREGNRDVRFVEELVAHLEARLPVDETRVFGTGYSSGGFLCNVIACQKSGLFRAIASNAGGAPYNQAEKWPNGYPKCPGQKPIAMLALHGGMDFGVTLDSGRFSSEYWAYVNGCDLGEMESTGYAECHLYRGCPPEKRVGFCQIDTLGHWVWDRAADATWTFFQRQ